MLHRINPNYVTLSRIGLIPALVATMLTIPERAHDRGAFVNFIDDNASTVAFVIFAVLSLTDALDGYIARSQKKVSTLGIFLDPLADKLLITAALVTLVQLDQIAAWIVVLIISREFAVTGLRMIAAVEGNVISAHWLGKAKTWAQIFLVLALIPPKGEVPEHLVTFLLVACVGLTIGSGIEYFWKGREHLRDTGSPPPPAE